MPSVCTQARTAVEIMQSYRCQTEQGTAYIDVNRMQLSMLRQIMTIYKNPQLNLKKHVNVNFHGEQGADLGGPSKEFFHSAISSLSKVDPVFNMQLFGGQDGHLIPFYGVDAVSSGCFQVAGKLVAHSLKNDGPGFVGLSPAVVKYLNTGSLEEAAVFVTMDDLTDLERKGFLQEKVGLVTINVELLQCLSRVSGGSMPLDAIQHLSDLMNLYCHTCHVASHL